MIRIKIEAIRLQSGMRPAGYVDDVLSQGEIVGDELQLAKEDYAALLRKYNPAVAEERARRKAICSGCPEFAPEGERCLNLGCGCPVFVGRFEPWEHLAECPAKRWKAT